MGAPAPGCAHYGTVIAQDVRSRPRVCTFWGRQQFKMCARARGACVFGSSLVQDARSRPWVRAFWRYPPPCLEH
eukprot:8900014-Karenia_brevis.AAC.1